MPILWFEEGLDELGKELTDVISAAVISPPYYKNYIFFLFLGLATSTCVIGFVAAIRLCLNQLIRRNNMDVMRNTARNLINASNAAKDKNADLTACQPMLPPSAAGSTDSSRLTSANHSRNTSTGSSTINAAVNNVAAAVHESNPERLMLLLENKRDSRRLLPKV